MLLLMQVWQPVVRTRFVSGHAFRHATVVFARRAFRRWLWALGLASRSQLMPGYSGTPLNKKLGIKDGFRVALLHVPTDVTAELRAAFGKCQIVKPAQGALDFAFLFAKSRTELERKIMTVARALAPAGMLWIAWPKKSSGVSSDLDENIVRGTGLGAGLVDIKVCAVTEVWSGLKFVIPVKDRLKGN